MTLLQRMVVERRAHNEALRLETRRELQAALADHDPGCSVVVFGSLIKPGAFSEDSDVDLALAAEPLGMSVYQFCSLLSERLGRRVDVLLLPECRFREKNPPRG